jgi:hypothetical protein
MLDRMVQTKEAWAAALTGGGMPLVFHALQLHGDFGQLGGRGVAAAIG